MLRSQSVVRLASLICVIVFVLAAQSPASAYGTGYHYAGAGDSSSDNQIATGIWAVFNIPSTPIITTSGEFAANYVGGYRWPNYANHDEWAQVGSDKRCCGNPKWYLEYID